MGGPTPVQMSKASARAVKSTHVLQWCKRKPIYNFAVGYKAPAGRPSLNLISDGHFEDFFVICAHNFNFTDVDDKFQHQKYKNPADLVFKIFPDSKL